MGKPKSALGRHGQNAKNQIKAMNISVSLPIPLNQSFDYALPKELEGKAALGLRVKVPFGKAVQTGYITALDTNPDLPSGIKLKSVLSIEDERVFYGKELFPLALFIEQNYANTLGETLGVLLPAIFNQKLLDAYKPSPSKDLPLFYPAGAYSQEQKNAIENAKQNQINLFYGANLSGKTEAALSLAYDVLNQGGQVLVLVPDIISSANLIEVINKKFGAHHILMWHSKVSLSKRKAAAAEIILGKPCIAVGTRSASLLPFKNLRLTLIFHEESKDFKQEDSKPYYHTREVAIERAHLTGGKVILISATPSLEALKLKEENKLKASFFPRPLPQFNNETQIIITPKTGKKSKLISDELIKLLHENMLHGGQSLLILNRLGYSGLYACLNCRAYAKCKKCGAVLSRIKTDKEDYLICRKCGAKESIKQICPLCKNEIFRSLGGGTQAAAEEIYKIFPQARVYRLDSQTLKTKKDEGHFAEEALKDNQADIIIGTNLALNAGLCGGKINLAALLDADLELNSADFRSAERFAQTLFNLKGRLNRYKNAKLIVQTSKDDLFDYNILKENKYLEFASDEAIFRKDFHFPPYAKLVKLLFTSKSEKDLNAFGEMAAKAVRESYGAFMSIEGPVKCGTHSKEFHQQYYLVKSADEQMLKGFLNTLANTKAPKKLQIKILAEPYYFT